MYYFVSDVHLGGGTPAEAKIAESRFVKWLDSIEGDATAIFICGDLFDFWFEYKRVIPKGFVRVLGRIANLTDRGIRVVFMAGNHDQWVWDYFETECGMEVYIKPHIFEVAGQRIYVAHGDNLNIKRDPLLKLMNQTFRSAWVRKLFSSLVHPDLALKFGQWWSRSSRQKHEKTNHAGTEGYLNQLLEHVSNVHASDPSDYYIFGHLHTIANHEIEDGKRAIFLNDWSQNPHCAVMDTEGNINIKEVKI